MTVTRHGRRHWLHLYRRHRWLHRWHRSIGALVAGFLLYLIATGLPLQFTAELDLGARHVSQPWILDWYGIEVQDEVRTSGGFSSVADTLFRNDQAVAQLPGFRGAVAFDGLLLAAGEQEILLFDPQSNTLLDRFQQSEGVLRIGLLSGRPVAETPSGIIAADRELVNWQRIDAGQVAIEWTDAKVCDDPESQRLRALVRARLLTVERLFQDLHSGRFFGALGIIVIDIATVLLLFLAASGLFLWWRRR